MSTFKLGADPEFYCVRKSDGLRISAHELVPGTKKEPHALPSGGAVQADGVAVEFNIPPSSTAKEFSDNITATLNDVRKMIPNTFEFRFRPYVEFSKVYFEKLPDPVKELGCDPDYNAFTAQQQRSPSAKAESPVRCFGGHIHVGWGKNLEGQVHFEDCCNIIKELESRALIPYYDATYYENKKRRTIYGSIGSFRPKPYGVEWRAPSNDWLASGPSYWMYMFRCVYSVFNRMSTGDKLDVYPIRPAAAQFFTM